MQYTLIWEDGFVSGVCCFKAFNTFEDLKDYLCYYFGKNAIEKCNFINKNKTVVFYERGE